MKYFWAIWLGCSLLLGGAWAASVASQKQTKKAKCLQAQKAGKKMSKSCHALLAPEAAPAKPDPTRLKPMSPALAKCYQAKLRNKKLSKKCQALIAKDEAETAAVAAAGAAEEKLIFKAAEAAQQKAEADRCKGVFADDDEYLRCLIEKPGVKQEGDEEKSEPVPGAIPQNTINSPGTSSAQ